MENKFYKAMSVKIEVDLCHVPDLLDMTNRLEGVDHLQGVITSLRSELAGKLALQLLAVSAENNLLLAQRKQTSSQTNKPSKTVEVPSTKKRGRGRPRGHRMTEKQKAASRVARTAKKLAAAQPVLSPEAYVWLTNGEQSDAVGLDTNRVEPSGSK